MDSTTESLIRYCVELTRLLADMYDYYSHGLEIEPDVINRIEEIVGGIYHEGREENIQ